MGAGKSKAREAEPCVQPALLARTSRELLGDRPLPSVLTQRPILFVLGPESVGKSSVARRLLGGPALALGGDGVRAALTEAGRRRGWSEALRTAPALLLDDVDCLHRRYGALRLLGGLLRERAAGGLRTALCQGSGDISVTELYEELPCELRASVLLRFPVGQGRRRFVAQRCRERGIHPALAQGAAALEPWSYARVEQLLDALGT